MLMGRYKYSLNVSCGLYDRYRLSGRRCHPEGPVRPVQEAQSQQMRAVERDSATRLSLVLKSLLKTHLSQNYLLVI